MNSHREKRLVRKVTPRIVPFIMLLYFITFLNRLNIVQNHRFSSMFEPIHGSAANPIATFWTAVQILKHLSERHAAQLKRTMVQFFNAKITETA